MEKKLIIELVVLIILFILFIYNNVKRNKISLRYALIWIASSVIMIFCAVSPNLMKKIANYIGIKTASNMIFLFIIGILVIITFILTVIVSKHKEKITLLVEEIGILKEKVNRVKKD